MPEELRPLRPLEARLVEAILARGDQTEAAATAGCTTRTARRLLKLPHVRAALTAAARESLREASEILAGGAASAALTMRRIADGRIVGDGVRLAACSRILEGACKLVDLLDLEDRIKTLEDGRSAPSRWRQPS